MTNKMTYVQAIENALKVVDGETAERLTALKTKLEERNTKRNDKKADADAEFKAVVVKALQVAGKPATVTELLATKVFGAEVTNQRVTSMLTKMQKTGEVIRETDKKKAFYTLPKETVEEEGDIEG